MKHLHFQWRGIIHLCCGVGHDRLRHSQRSQASFVLRFHFQAWRRSGGRPFSRPLPHSHLRLEITLSPICTLDHSDKQNTRQASNKSGFFSRPDVDFRDKSETTHRNTDRSLMVVLAESVIRMLKRYNICAYEKMNSHLVRDLKSATMSQVYIAK